MTNLLFLIALFLLVGNGEAGEKSTVFFIESNKSDATVADPIFAMEITQIGCQNTIPATFDMTFLMYYPNLEKLIGVNCDFAAFNFSVYTSYGQLITLPKVETLKITDGHIDHIGSHSFLSVPNLEKLKLQNNKITRIARDAFSNLSNLRKLELPNNRLKALPIDVFASLPKLGKVELKENEFFKLDLDMFEHNPDLTTVDMTDNPLKEFVMFHSCRTLSWYVADTRLVKKQVKGAKLNLNNDAAIIWADKMTNVHILAANYSGTLGVQEKLRTVSSVQTLDLSRNGIKALRVKAFEKMTGLLSVRLDGNYLTVLDCPLLLNLLPALQHLSLANNLWSCVALTQMLSSLEERKIDFSPVSSVGVNVNGVGCQLDGNQVGQTTGTINEMKRYQEIGLMLSAVLSILMCFLYGVNVCIRTRRGKQLRCCVYVE